MSIFDGIINSYFRINAEGDTEYYPHGIFGKGYIVPHEEKENEIRNFLKKFLFSSILIIPIVVTICFITDFIYLLYFIPLLAVLLILITKFQTKDLSITQNKMKWNESLKSSADSYSIGTLWLLLLGSIIFVLFGIFLLISGKGSMLFKFIDIIFFGACTIIFLKMIKLKHS